MQTTGDCNKAVGNNVMILSHTRRFVHMIGVALIVRDAMSDPK